MLHLLQPMGGAGMRFSQEVGFNVPKPLIDLQGKPFFYWATKSVLDQIPTEHITFVVLKDHVRDYNIDKVILHYFSFAEIVMLDHQLNGPVLTCLSGLEMAKKYKNDPLLINDCDHAFKSKALEEILSEDEPGNALVTFKSREPQFSYVMYNKTGKIVGTKEKQVVSEDAICGAYLFKNADTFINAAETYVVNGLGEYKEYFLSGVYNILAKNQNQTIRVAPLDLHVSFGTPAEYRTVLKEHEMEKEFPREKNV